jgi:hypothetical protein
VVLAGQILHGNDRLGHWKVTQLEGWGESPPVRVEDTPRTNYDGDHDMPVRYAARLVTIGGRVICPSEAAAQQTRNRLTGLVRATVRAQVTDLGETTWADVKLADKVDAKRVGRLVRFQYQLRAPNPRRFGNAKTLAVATGAPISVFHRGNYDAMPSFIVRGDMPGGYTITLNGWNYTVTKPIVTGAPHRIDYNNGRLYINGVLNQGNLGNVNTTPIPPGQSVAVGLYPVSTGSGSADITITDTYI